MIQKIGLLGLLFLVVVGCDEKRFSSIDGVEKMTDLNYKIVLQEVAAGNVAAGVCSVGLNRTVTVTAYSDVIKIVRRSENGCHVVQVCSEEFSAPYPFDFVELARPVTLTVEPNSLPTDRGERTLSLSYLYNGESIPVIGYGRPASQVYANTEPLFDALFSISLSSCVITANTK